MSILDPYNNFKNDNKEVLYILLIIAMVIGMVALFFE